MFNRVLAFNLATEISHEELQNVTGGATKYTQQLTHYFTNKHGSYDVETDMDFD
ncbi:bacteriocin [Legionella sp. D16C41]|uniref:bacteriocin n=1 Tax=Legionella sp. D16C41 TaxID=3402688 RepID=UPI003AF599E1